MQSTQAMQIRQGVKWPRIMYQSPVTQILQHLQTQFNISSLNIYTAPWYERPTNVYLQISIEKWLYIILWDRSLFRLLVSICVLISASHLSSRQINWYYTWLNCKFFSRTVKVLWEDGSFYWDRKVLIWIKDCFIKIYNSFKVISPTRAWTVVEKA